MTVAYESSGESLEGQIAVASVIKTRMKERGLSEKEVVLAKNQFSCWKNGKPTQKRKLTKKEIIRAKKAWELSKPGEYNHYHAKEVNPKWARSARKIKEIGNHIFVKL